MSFQSQHLMSLTPALIVQQRPESSEASGAKSLAKSSDAEILLRLIHLIQYQWTAEERAENAAA